MATYGELKLIVKVAVNYRLYIVISILKEMFLLLYWLKHYCLEHLVFEDTRCCIIKHCCTIKHDRFFMYRFRIKLVFVQASESD